jgi:hypothetical protein
MGMEVFEAAPTSLQYMQVLEGRIDFTLDGEAVTLTSSDPALFIPRGHTHSFKFCKGVVTRLREKINPPGDFKEAFFEDLSHDELRCEPASRRDWYARSSIHKHRRRPRGLDVSAKAQGYDEADCKVVVHCTCWLACMHDIWTLDPLAWTVPANHQE